MEATLIGLVVSALVPKLLELLKSQRWAPFIDHLSPRLNRTTAVIVATLTTVGVTLDFNPAAGTLTIGGLLPDQILGIVLTWILNFALQEAVYRKFVNRSDQYVGRNGFPLIPIILAAGLGASCATTGRILVETERGLHATIAGADDAINAACDAKLRSEADCKAFNASIAAAWSAYENFNKAAQEGSVAAVPAMVAAVSELRAAVESARPQATAIIDDLKKLYAALQALLPKEKDDAEAEPARS